MSALSASAVTANDATMSSKTIVTFADLYRESPGVVTSTEPSFVVLIDDCECC
jgi:hypothetical protein